MLLVCIKGFLQEICINPIYANYANKMDLLVCNKLYYDNQTLFENLRICCLTCFHHRDM